MNVDDRVRNELSRLDLMEPPDLLPEIAQRVEFGSVDLRQDEPRPRTPVGRAILAVGVVVGLVAGSLALVRAFGTETSDRDRGPLAPGGGSPFSEPLRPSEENALRACIGRAGYDWEEVYPVWNSPEHPPEGSVFADRAFWDAWEICVVETGLVEPFSSERIAAENHEVRTYVRCMRNRGWALPDPEPWEGPYHPGLLTPGDFDVPEDPEAADRYYRDSADCGIPVYDENDNLLPLVRSEE